MKKILALAAAAAVLPVSAHAVTYDAFSSFDGTQGAGNFRWSSSAPGSVIPLSSVDCVINNTICLGLPEGSFGLPGVFKSTGVPSTSHPYQPLDRLLVHPGSASALLGLFVAPVDGTYSFSATFDALTSGTSVAVFALASVAGNPVFGTGIVNNVVTTRTFTGTIALEAGNSIVVGLNNAGNFSNDSTGLQFSVTQLDSAVPEPSTWLMMLLGMGMVGATMRRARTRVSVRYAQT